MVKKSARVWIFVCRWVESWQYFMAGRTYSVFSKGYRDLALQSGCWKADRAVEKWPGSSKAGAGHCPGRAAKLEQMPANLSWVFPFCWRFCFSHAVLLIDRAGLSHSPCLCSCVHWLVQGGLRCNNTLSLFITGTKLQLEDPRVPTKARLSFILLSLL